MKVNIEIEIDIKEAIGIGEAIDIAIEKLNLKEGRIISASVSDDYGGGIQFFDSPQK